MTESPPNKRIGQHVTYYVAVIGDPDKAEDDLIRNKVKYVRKGDWFRFETKKAADKFSERWCDES